MYLDYSVNDLPGWTAHACRRRHDSTSSCCRVCLNQRPADADVSSCPHPRAFARDLPRFAGEVRELWCHTSALLVWDAVCPIRALSRGLPRGGIDIRPAVSEVPSCPHPPRAASPRFAGEANP